ncbi:MAG: sigma 54-interacting transcriptional regulator [bacterium]|nr:sigma 54-interacting transcriptional regulator [bacterium]
MIEIAFTFFAVGRTAPTILTFVIAAYLLLRRRPDQSTAWLGAYFLLLGIFNLAYLAAYSVQDLRAAYAWIPACAICFAAVARLQFAYVFPAPVASGLSPIDALDGQGDASAAARESRAHRDDSNFAGWQLERRIVFALSSCAALFALVDYVWRSGSDFVPLFEQYSFGSRYSSPFVPAVSALCYFWSIVVALRIARRTRRTDPVAFRAALQLAGVTAFELGVSGLNLISTASVLAKATVATLSNVAVLLILSTYVFVYASAARKRTGFMHRLVGIALVTILGLLALTSLGLRGPAFDQLRRETAAETRLALAQAGAAQPEVQILPANAPAADSPPAKASAQDGFIFFERGGELFFALSASGIQAGVGASQGVQNKNAASIVAFPYARFRERIHASAFPIALMMLGAALLVLFAFPLLFRASLVSPLKSLADDLGRIYRSRKDDSRSQSEVESDLIGADDAAGASDEIVALRLAFRQMTSLLEEARESIPEYAPHLERVRQAATGEPRRIPIGDGELVFRSVSMQLVVEAVERLRSFRHPVLIAGETGTGKEMIARLLHQTPEADSDKASAQAPFVAVNCAALPESLWESEVFGHRRGAFTDARSDRAGRISEAGHGTLFFDEIGEMPLAIQAKMLRLLQELEYVPLGADRPVRARCRFVFATHRDLDAMVRAGEFRSDLLYRIQVFQVSLPPLRDRPEDIAELTDYYLERFIARHPTEIQEIDASTHELLGLYAWPGNIRELENNMLRAIAFAKGDVLLPEHFDLDALQAGAHERRAGSNSVAASHGTEGPDGVAIDFDEQVRRYSRSLIERALDLADGNKSEAARILGLKRTTLRNRMRDLGISGEL